MIITLDMSSSIPIYVQLRNEIVMGIGLGKLKVGEGLPTVRQMAQDIGVNNMTVNKAYNILKTEGYIEIDRRHGAKVSPALDLTREFKEKLESELLLIIAESTIKGVEKKDFLKMCSDIFDSMNGFDLIGGDL
ncbi:GntR family transcriptional regulator [Clostridium sp. SHJSY1]|uniref:GntR family transcriptional regulator n=1 Tax=Clostridium sp. SHJSY1 TaxID=2942483 RepID=UPI0028755D4B|nr:GntR family transcriptional regulator [Clostridium sp. SHJSY1]MDS0524586.1 GntR family transcriptional regulator [Clostridium sp. SHJSY1]